MKYLNHAPFSSQPATDAYRKNFDATFGAKKRSPPISWEHARGHALGAFDRMIVEDRDGAIAQLKAALVSLGMPYGT